MRLMEHRGAAAGRGTCHRLKINHLLSSPETGETPGLGVASAALLCLEVPRDLVSPQAAPCPVRSSGRSSCARQTSPGRGRPPSCWFVVVSVSSTLP